MVSPQQAPSIHPAVSRPNPQPSLNRSLLAPKPRGSPCLGLSPPWSSALVATHPGTDLSPRAPEALRAIEDPSSTPTHCLTLNRASWVFLARPRGIGLACNRPCFIREGDSSVVLAQALPPATSQRSPSSLPALSLFFHCSVLPSLSPSNRPPGLAPSSTQRPQRGWSRGLFCDV